jgi:hypothetical protein
MWRKNSFNSISHQISPTKLVQLQAKLANTIASDNLGPLLKCFFGPSASVVLEKQHITLINELVSLAWNLNSLLKGSIVILGDFRPMAYRYGSTFDVKYMSEFEGKRGEKIPEHILSTIGLGMTLLRARGGEEEPEQIILCKALVASEKLFE